MDHIIYLINIKESRSAKHKIREMCQIENSKIADVKARLSVITSNAMDQTLVKNST